MTTKFVSQASTLEYKKGKDLKFNIKRERDREI